ncbi:MAG: hypothetical protein ACRDIF_01720 [Actinomycetota bacterium]
MGVLSEIEEGFADLRGSPRLERRFESWKKDHACLAVFASVEELIAFVRGQAGEYRDRDEIVFALCREAQAEAKTTDRGRRVASDVLFWLFLPALWRVFEEATRPGLADPEEIEAEILLGFWEAATEERSSSEKLSGRLVNAARHRAWKAVRRAVREAGPQGALDEEPAEDFQPHTVEWSEPWVLVCWARAEGHLDETEAELIFWTRLQGEPLKMIGKLLGLSDTAARSCRNRAERRLAGWLARSSATFPPEDPDLAARVLALAQEPSPLAQVLRGGLPQTGPDSCL